MGQIGGPVDYVAVQGNYAYIGEGWRLVILDVSDPTHPTVVGQTDFLRGAMQGVALVGDYVHVASGGLVILRFVPNLTHQVYLPLALRN